MESYRANKFLFVTSVLSIMVLTLGTTFSFFTVSSQSKYDAVKVEANKIQLALSVDKQYTGHELIPINDDDIIKAYKNKCVDLYERGSCLAYTIEVSNFNSKQDLIGTIDFNVTGIDNLSYMLLDEEENIYLSKQEIEDGIFEKLSLGEHFILDDATESNPSTKKFTLLIWLTNLDKNQNATDAGGNFTASISYESVIFGSKLTGTLTDFVASDENNDTGVEDV